MGVLEFLGFKPTKKSFVARLLRALPDDDGEWVVDMEGHSLRHPGGLEVNFQNLFLEYSRSPALSRASLIEKYASLALAQTREVPDLWIEAAPNLIPTVRSEFVESSIEIRQRGGKPGYDPIVYPFAGDLRVRLMYDFGPSLTYVRGEKLKTWGQPADAVLERAKANLGRIEPPEWFDLGRGVFQLHSNVSYEESYLLLDSVVRMLPFAASAVFMPCNRGILLAADGGSADAVEAMLLKAEEMMLEAPWPMSSTICRRGEHGWEAVEAPKACANLAHGLAIRHQAENYALQKEALDAWHQERNEDLYVAEFTVSKAAEQWQSYCVWGQGYRVLLPVTDWVALVPEADDKEHIRVTWRDLEEISGARLQSTNESPPRFLVESFPDGAEWERLSARQISP
jgi:hypothetical protein